MTWPWPWPVLSMTFTLIQYLRLTFESVSAEFGPVWVKLAVLRTKMLKRSIFTFDLTLTWHVTFEENFLVCFRTVSPRPFQRPLARLAAVIGLGVSLGGRYTPPPRSMAFGWDPGQARVKWPDLKLHFQSLRACQGHIEDPNSLKLAVCNMNISIYD